MFKLSDHSIAVVVLAAGRGLRMGANPKLLLPLADGNTVLWHTVQNAVALHPADLLVVARPDMPTIPKLLDPLPARCIQNPRYAEGMATSLAAGISSLEESIEAALIMLGDEPGVSGKIVETLVEAYLEQRKPITVPVYGNVPGPPTLFSCDIFAALVQLRGDTGGKQLITRYPDLVCRVPFPQDQRPVDIDTPEDYRALL